MNEAEAMEAFGELVAFNNQATGEDIEPDWDEPTFNVRLDADSDDHKNGELERTWRLRVTVSRSLWGAGTVDLQAILAIAEEADATVAIQNGGLELS